MPIYFYSTQEEPYGCFSNFSAHGFELDAVYWRTSEHYFQAQKFAPHPEHVEALRAMPSPRQGAVARGFHPHLAPGAAYDGFFEQVVFTVLDNSEAKSTYHAFARGFAL